MKPHEASEIFTDTWAIEYDAAEDQFVTYAMSYVEPTVRRFTQGPGTTWTEVDKEDWPGGA